MIKKVHTAWNPKTTTIKASSSLATVSAGMTVNRGRTKGNAFMPNFMQGVSYLSSVLSASQSLYNQPRRRATLPGLVAGRPAR